MDAKCSCQHCGGHIVFEAQDTGRIIHCPHCGVEVILASEIVIFTSSEIEPGVFSEAVVTGAGLIEKGVADFKKWSRTMIYHFGEPIRPNLERIWIAALSAEPTLSQAEQLVPSRRYLIWSGSFVIVGLVSWLIIHQIDIRHKVKVLSVVDNAAATNQTSALVQAAIDLSQEAPSATQTTNDFAQLQVRAEMGDATAQYKLGKYYEKGNAVDLDYFKAVKWYRKAAAQGHVQAQSSLGFCYVKGFGVTQDYTEATMWFRMAANQGDAVAQCNLGVSYVSGKGVPQDYSLATSWFKRAIEQGNTNAEIQLQRLNKYSEAKHTQSNDKSKILSEIVANYHKTHSYIGTQSGALADIYVCGDMACDVWNMVQKEGINAKIQVGNVDKDIKSIRDANHAWVLAETSPGNWLALEATGGFVVPMTKNSKYYWGWSFQNPKMFRDHVEIKHQRWVAVRKYNDAITVYNQAVNEYKSAAGNIKFSAGIKMSQSTAILSQRKSDLEVLDRKFYESISGR